MVCGNCSDNKAPLQYRNFQADRVCDDCYEYLLKGKYFYSKLILKNLIFLNFCVKMKYLKM